MLLHKNKQQSTLCALLCYDMMWAGKCRRHIREAQSTQGRNIQITKDPSHSEKETRFWSRPQKSVKHNVQQIPSNKVIPRLSFSSSWTWFLKLMFRNLDVCVNKNINYKYINGQKCKARQLFIFLMYITCSVHQNSILQYFLLFFFDFFSKIDVCFDETQVEEWMDLDYF